VKAEVEYRTREGERKKRKTAHAVDNARSVNSLRLEVLHDAIGMREIVRTRSEEKQLHSKVGRKAHVKKRS
jgi:hypothetical protein